MVSCLSELKVARLFQRAVRFVHPSGALGQTRPTRRNFNIPTRARTASKPPMKTQSHRGKVGLFGIGLAAYWPQFKGLRTRLKSYHRIVAGRLGEFCDVVDAGLVDTAPRAAAAGELFTRESVELVLCYVATYATSSQVLPAVQRVSPRCPS